MLSEMGAKRIIAMANRETQAKFLTRVGATEVVYPEKDIAERLAIKYSSANVFDYIQLTPEYSIFEIPIFDGWAGHTIESLKVRATYNLNILAVKKSEFQLMPSPQPTYTFEKNDHIIVLGKQDEVLKIAERAHK